MAKDERSAWEAAARKLDAALDPVVAELVAACRAGLGVIERLHRRLTDDATFDLSAEDRALAIWELSGHAIALSHAILDQVELGHTAQLGGTSRALVETHALVLAMTGGGDDLVRKWLKGGYVSPKEANQGREQLYNAVLEQLNRSGNPIELHPAYRAQREGLDELGLDPEAGLVGILDSINGRVYGSLSEAAHNRRKSVRRHPDARKRLFFAIESAGYIETTVLDVGESLKDLLGYDVVVGEVMAAQAIVHEAYARADAVLASFASQ